MQRNIKLTLEYDGTNYHGWQSQRSSSQPTIQDVLEQALASLAGEPVAVYSSGRTDAGVHALGHVANFFTTSAIPPESWAPALNHLLPPDIRVLHSEEVPAGFHARYSARGKVYRYLILNRQAPSALYRHSTWHVSRRLNLAAMRRAAARLIGRHDFSAFRASACSARSPVRTMKSLVVSKRGALIEVRLEANAFLQHMARTIVGTLVDAGLGRFTPDDVASILASRDRRKAGRTAPAQGLSLVEVHYPDKVNTVLPIPL